MRVTQLERVTRLLQIVERQHATLLALRLVALTRRAHEQRGLGALGTQQRVDLILVGAHDLVGRVELTRLLELGARLGQAQLLLERARVREVLLDEHVGLLLEQLATLALGLREVVGVGVLRRGVGGLHARARGAAGEGRGAGLVRGDSVARQGQRRLVGELLSDVVRVGLFHRGGTAGSRDEQQAHSAGLHEGQFPGSATGRQATANASACALACHERRVSG